MIRVTVTYFKQAGARFDMDYYMTTHMPMVERLMRPKGMLGWSVDTGVEGILPAMLPDFQAQAQMIFENLSDFQAALAAESAALLADIPKFTDIQPRIQVSSIAAAQWPAVRAGA